MWGAYNGSDRATKDVACGTMVGGFDATPGWQLRHIGLILREHFTTDQPHFPAGLLNLHCIHQNKLAKLHLLKAVLSKS